MDLKNYIQNNFYSLLFVLIHINYKTRTKKFLFYPKHRKERIMFFSSKKKCACAKPAAKPAAKKAPAKKVAVKKPVAKK